jgi:uncharacterized protein YaiE (UPF0345 family)
MPLQWTSDFGVEHSNALSLEIAFGPFTFPITDNEAHIVQGRLQYRGALSADWGQNGLGAKLTHSPDASTFEIALGTAQDSSLTLSVGMGATVFAGVDVALGEGGELLQEDTVEL